MCLASAIDAQLRFGLRLVFSTAIVVWHSNSSWLRSGLSMNKKQKCVVCFLGDGACNTGAFHEAVNMAAVWKLPVIFACENNRYASSVPISLSTSACIVERARVMECLVHA